MSNRAGKTSNGRVGNRSLVAGIRALGKRLDSYGKHLYTHCMDKRGTQVSETLLRVVNKIVRNEKAPRSYGVDELLHPSEIHMVMFIGNNTGTHLSELARIVGVTRGAVSQVVAKLEKKGLLEKAVDPHNHLKTVPVLTSKGQVAFWNHERYHEEVDAELIAFIEQLSDREVGVIEAFLGHLEKMADRHR